MLSAVSGGNKVADDNLIKPEVAKPKGIPPKKLLVSVFGLLSLTAIVFSLFSNNKEESSTADGVAQEAASKLTDQDRQTIGTGSVAVKEAADASGVPAEFRIGTNSSVSTAPTNASGTTQSGVPNPYGANTASTTGFPQNNSVYGNNQSPQNSSQRHAGQQNTGDVDRAVETLNSKLKVFDFDDSSIAAQTKKSAGVNAQLNEIDRELESIRKGGGAAQAKNQTDAMFASMVGGTPASNNDSARANDSKFVKEFAADTEVKKGLRSSRMESPYTVMEGSVIPAITLREINTDLPGVVTAQVTTDVYDSLTSRYPLICKGSKFVGRYNNDVQVGQSRLQFAFTRLILTDGQSFALTGFDGSDMAGSAGVEGDVNNHFLKIYGTSLAIGVLADQVTKTSAVPQGTYAQPSATGQIMVETTKNILNRNRNISPTITYERGSLINVEVKRDMVFQNQAQRSCK